MKTRRVFFASIVAVSAALIFPKDHLYAVTLPFSREVTDDVFRSKYFGIALQNIDSLVPRSHYPIEMELPPVEESGGFVISPRGLKIRWYVDYNIYCDKKTIELTYSARHTWKHI